MYIKIPQNRKQEFDIDLNRFQAIEPVLTVHGYYVIPFDVIEKFNIQGELRVKLEALETVELTEEDFPKGL